MADSESNDLVVSEIAPNQYAMSIMDLYSISLDDETLRGFGNDLFSRRPRTESEC